MQPDETIHIEGDTTKADAAIQDAESAISDTKSSVGDTESPKDDTKTPPTHAEVSATFKREENTCVVEHGLGTKPSAVKVNGIPEQYFSYIVDIDDTQFQVNLHVPVDEETTFTWQADIE